MSKKCWVVTEGDYSDYHIVAIYANRADADAHAAPKETRCWKCRGTGRLPEERCPPHSMLVTTPPGDECVMLDGVRFVGVYPERECGICRGKGCYSFSEFDVEDHELT
jgi:hypothetical protein